MPHSFRRPLSRLGWLVLVVALAATLLIAARPPASATTTSSTTAQSAARPHATKPTIVLVHGAWADSSGWNAEIRALGDKGYPVMAVSNPLRGLTSDVAYVRSILDTIDGPVVLVGHSYGGAVISGAAAGATNVKALVYVAAFMPDEGEPVGLLTQLNPGSLVTEDALTVRPYPTAGGGTAVDLYLKESVFREAFAADLPQQTTRLMWATQRPLAAAAFSEPAGPAAWHTIPSWYLLATRDRTIPPATQSYMATRAGATITQVSSSHVAMQSRPAATTELILAAAHTVS
ncbi:alpha/beta hydrolase [Intrasporangium mesophilum]